MKLLGSRVVSGNSQEDFGPVVMEMASANAKIRHVFYFFSPSTPSSNIVKLSGRWSKVDG